VAMKNRDLAAPPPSQSGSRSNPQAKSAVFACNGEYWTIGYGDLTFSLRDVKGLSYVKRLLQHPGQEFHVLDLLTGPGALFADDTSSSDKASVLRRSDVKIGGLGDSGEMLDAQAKREYQRKLRDLAEDLEELRERSDSERADAVQAEIDFLKTEIARAVGLGGRDRRAGSTAERARLNVTRAIKSALQKIFEHHQALGELLEGSIRTGSFCSYAADPAFSIKWQFSQDGTPQPLAPAATEPFLFRRDTGFIGASSGVTAFVGRETERASLLLLLDQVTRGEGRVAMLAGRAGVGKTRMATETSGAAAERGFLTFRGNCYDRDDAVPFIPVVEILENAFARASSPEAFRQALGDNAAEIARLVPQLRRTFNDIPPPLEISPEQSRRVLFNAVTEFLVRATANSPVLLILEDLHWADEGTLSLLTHVAHSISKLPVMIVGTFRDNELDSAGPLAKTLDQFTRLHLLERVNLYGLSRNAVSEMIHILSGQQPPSSLVEAIYSGTGGNPFFVEELYKHLKEHGRLSDPKGEFRSSFQLDNSDVPQSLRLVIERNLAGLTDETRKILQTAAIIGGSFTFGLLEASTNAATDPLLDCVEEAEKTGIISSTLDYPEALFRFSHELIRQTVLSEISAPRRQRLHLSVAEAIERIGDGALEDHANDLAHHLWQAGKNSNTDKTVRYLTIAAKRALVQSAYEAALRHLQNALHLIANSPESKERSHQELGLRIDHGLALLAVNGWYIPEVGNTYKRARELCQELALAGDPRLFSVVFGLWMHHLVRGEHRDARYFAEECRQLAGRLGDDKLTLYAAWALGCSQHFMGELAAAHETYEIAIRSQNLESHAGLFGFGQDPLMSCLYYDAVTLWILGRLDGSRERERQAEALARKLGHPFTLTWYLDNDAMFCQLRHDFSSADARIAESFPICEEYGLAHHLIILRGLQAMSLVGQGKMAVPLPAVTPDQKLVPAGHDLYQPWARGTLAEALARQGNPSKAVVAIDHVLELVERIEERFFEAELHRIKGEAILIESEKETDDVAGRQARAERSFRDAIAIANRQEAQMFKLRASISLSRLQIKKGHKAAAAETLRGVCNSFGEGLESADLTEARNLLLTLA
jgi:hypothetical protein